MKVGGERLSKSCCTFMRPFAPLTVQRVALPRPRGLPIIHSIELKPHSAEIRTDLAGKRRRKDVTVGG